MNTITFLMEYKMVSVIKCDINTYVYIHYSGMHTSSYTLYGSKYAPSCFHFPGVVNIALLHSGENPRTYLANNT